MDSRNFLNWQEGYKNESGGDKNNYSLNINVIKYLYSLGLTAFAPCLRAMLISVFAMSSVLSALEIINTV